MIWVSKLKEVTRIMYMKLNHKCAFLKMYTNNLIQVFKKPLFENIFSLFKKFKTSFYFFQMIKNTFSPSKSSMEEHFSTLNNHNH
jgi:hypothetical protein